MGYRLLQLAFLLGADALRAGTVSYRDVLALAAMAHPAIDDDAATPAGARYWAGWEQIASAIGYTVPPEPDAEDHGDEAEAARRMRRAQRNAIAIIGTRLVRAGLIVRVGRARPGANAVYRLNLGTVDGMRNRDTEGAAQHGSADDNGMRKTHSDGISKSHTDASQITYRRMRKTHTRRNEEEHSRNQGEEITQPPAPQHRAREASEATKSEGPRESVHEPDAATYEAARDRLTARIGSERLSEIVAERVSHTPALTPTRAVVTLAAETLPIRDDDEGGDTR